MTETQNPQAIDHRAPLKPGEIRTHRVGAQVFQVMHIAGGSFAQASVAGNGMATRVLRTDRFADVAVRAYADAIEQAESDAIDALDDADGSMFIGSASGALIDPEATPDYCGPKDDGGWTCAPAHCDRPTECPLSDVSDIAPNEPQRWTGWTSHGHAMRGIPQVGERPRMVARCGGPAMCQTCGREEVAATTPEKSLVELLNAYGEAMARGGIELSYAFNSGLPLTTSAAVHAERADALKVEILARFGGER